MKTNKLLMFYFIILLFSGCVKKSPQADQAVDVQSEFQYQIMPEKIDGKDITVECSLTNDFKKGVLILYLKVINNSEDNILVDCQNSSLAMGDGSEAIPETATFKSILQSGDEAQYEMHYHPINSADLFSRTNYEGDMKQRYILKLNFITDNAGRQLLDKGFTIELKDADYYAYLVKYGKNKDIQLFDFNFDKDTFIKAQKDYLNTALPLKRINETKSPVFAQEQYQDNFVFVTNAGITVNRMMINIFSYKLKDTLFLNMRLLNQDRYTLRISLAKSIIQATQCTYAVSSIFSDSFEKGRIPDDTLILRSGTRLHLLLKYYVPEKIDSYRLKMDWLTIDGIHAENKDEIAKLFCSDLSLKLAHQNRR